MRKVRLGKTGLKVSRVGMGGIPLTRTPEDKVVELVNRALDAGINFIDTAVTYFTSEERIGRGIAGRRDEVYIATKTPAKDAKTAEDHLSRSLKQLGVKHIDLWQFHGVMSQADIDRILSPGGAMEAAKQAQKEGKVTHIGASSHNFQAAKLLIASGAVETIQHPFNCLSTEYEELIHLAKENDVGFIAMKPFAGGHIKDPRLAIGYLLQFPNVVPIPGVEFIDQIEEVARLAEHPPKLVKGDWETIKFLKEKLGIKYCRQCEYCMPCPQGVFIPGILYLGRLYEEWPPERYFNWAYVQRAVESASKCVKCGSCEPKCLFGLPIREMIDESLAFHSQVAENWIKHQKT